MKITVFMLHMLASLSLLYSQSGITFQKENNKQNSGNVFLLKPNNLRQDKTAAAASDLYYIEDFEGVVPPNGWQTRNVEGYYQWRGENVGYQNSRGALLSCQITDEMPEIDWLITPQRLAAAQDSLSFYIKQYSSDPSTADTFRVLVSTLNVVPNEGSALDSAFTDTLAVYDVSEITNWKRCAFSLAKYAGQKIYIGFKEHNILGNGVCLDNVIIGYKYFDIALTKINISKNVPLGYPVKPAVEFENFSLERTSFEAVLEIPSLSYICKKTVEIGKDSTVLVEFDEWTPLTAGSYDAKASANIEGDINVNDNSDSLEIAAMETLQSARWHLETETPVNFAAHGSFSYVKKSPGAPDTTFVYAMSGFTNIDSAEGFIYKYNTLSREWRYAGTLPFARFYFMPVELNGKVYIAGGFIESETYSSLLIYDIATETFSSGADMPNPLCYYAAATYGDSLIYLLGGMTEWGISGITADVLVYNVNTDAWANATPLPDDNLMGLSGCILGGKIVLTGSYELYTGLSNKVYFGEIDPSDPYTIDWRSERRPNEGITASAGGGWYGKEKSYAVFAGGQTMTSQFNTCVWVYDLNDKKWFMTQNKLISTIYMSNLSPVVRNDSVFMVVNGGMVQSGPPYNTNEWLYIGNDVPLTYTSRDAAAVSAELPDTMLAGNSFTPSALFKNRQLSTQTFTATVKITPGSYISIDTVKALAYNQTKQVSFAGWTPDTAGTYTIKIYTSLSGDEDKTNDTLTAQIAVAKKIGINDGSGADIPKEYDLEQNYPNPFNPATKIKYALPHAGYVELKVYDMLGREITSLVNEYRNAGYHEAMFNASSLRLSSGVYIYRIQAGSFVQTKKLMLIK